MSYNLFLDDERFPPDDPRDWVIQRSFATAVHFVCKNGFPSFVSFDHDLGDSAPQTGYDFAKWLVERDIDYGDLPDDFSFVVHSANPVGAKNIQMYLDNYLRVRKNG